MNPATKTVELFKLCGAKWSSMKAEEKAIYEQMALKDQALYDARMKQRVQHGFFTFEDGTKSTDPANALRVYKKPKRTNNVVSDGETYREVKAIEPPGEKSAYNYYVADFKPPKGTANLDRMKLASQSWKTMKPEDKVKYEEKNLKDKARRAMQMTSFRRYGYFLLDDGSKSTDTKPNKRSASAPLVAETKTKRAKNDKNLVPVKKPAEIPVKAK